MQPTKVTERIKAKALELLEQHPEGLRYSELHEKILAADSTYKPNTINGCIWNLDATYPEKVYKPSKGLFRLLKNKPSETEVLALSGCVRIVR
jgi:SLT domain-containing protein